MPFKDDLEEVYHQAIKPACNQSGFESLRIDELMGPFNIHRKIIEYIFSSDVIVADLTGWNPNVSYELGVAHAIDNKTIMIIQEGEKPPFDFLNYRIIRYERTKAGLNKLQANLVESLKSIEEWRKNPSNPVQDFKPYDASILQKSFNQPNQFYSCFISYSSKDQEFASKLYNDLQEVGVRCWFDAKDLKIGDRWVDQIKNAIQAHDKVLLVLSQASVESYWVQQEIKNALRIEREQNKTILFPLRLDDAIYKVKDDAILIELIREKQVGDFRNWEEKESYRRAISRLVRDLTVTASVESEGRTDA